MCNMYIKTIEEFLEDISFLVKDPYWKRNGKNINDINESDQNNQTKKYLNHLVNLYNKNKSIEIVLNNNTQEKKVQDSIIWKLLKSNYKIQNDEEIVANLKNIKKDTSEISSWIFSLPALANILNGNETDKNNNEFLKFLKAQIVLEGRFYYGNRIDVSIIGKNHNGKPAMVLIENKRWSNLEAYTPNPQKKCEVRDPYYKSQRHEIEYIPHPCDQVEQYRARFKNVNGFIQSKLGVKIDTAVYLHNSIIDEKKIEESKNNGLLDNLFDGIIGRNPVFYGTNGKNANNQGKETLLKYLQSKITTGRFVRTPEKKISLAEAIYGSKVKFSKKYLDFLYQLSKNKHIEKQKKIFDILLDEKQKACITDIIEQIKKKKKKKIFIIKGAAGTGKSFMGLALLVYLATKKEVNTQKKRNKDVKNNELTPLSPLYLIKCLEPRTAIENLYEFQAQYTVNGNDYECIICDDAQRYQDKFTSKDTRNPLETIINNSKVSVFFIDEKQIVHINDDITEEKIRSYANSKKKRINISKRNEYNLEEQYRMKYAGLKEVEFLNIVDNILGKLPKFPIIENDFGEYEFAIADSPSVLFSRIRRKNKIRQDNGYASRVVAGKGKNWKWSTNVFEQTIDPAGDGKKYKSWKYGDKKWKYVDKITFTTVSGLDKDGGKPKDSSGKPIDAVDYVGCIDFCQGVNLEYVGVIIAKDLKYEDNKVKVKLDEHSEDDSCFTSFSTNPPLADDDKKDRIKNSYRILLTRGERGCYIYCCDPKLQEHLKDSNNTLHFPSLKSGEIKQETKNKEYYVSCEGEIEKYWISIEAKKEIEYKVKKESETRIMNVKTSKVAIEKNIEILGKKVTFIVKNEDDKLYAISLELDDPLPDDYFTTETTKNTSP